MHDQLDVAGMAREELVDAIRVADVELFLFELARISLEQQRAQVGGRGLRPEEAGAHVVLDPDDRPAALREVHRALRADEAARACDDRCGQALGNVAVPVAYASCQTARLHQWLVVSSSQVGRASWGETSPSGSRLGIRIMRCSRSTTSSGEDR